MAKYSSPNWGQVNVDDRASMYALSQGIDMLSKGLSNLGNVGNQYLEAERANALLERDKRSLALANKLRNVEGVEQARAAIAGIDSNGWYDTSVINNASEQGLKRGIDLTTSKNTAEALGKIQAAQDANGLSKALEFMSQAGPYVDTSTTGSAISSQNNLFENRFDRAQRAAQSDREFALRSQEASLRREDQLLNRQVSGLQLQNQLIAAERSRLAEAAKGLPESDPRKQEYVAQTFKLEQQALNNQAKLASLYGIDVSSFNTGSQYLGGNNSQTNNVSVNPQTSGTSTATAPSNPNTTVNTPVSNTVDWRQMLRDQAGAYGEAGMPITSSGALKTTPAGFVDERVIVNPAVQQNVVQQPVAPSTNPNKVGANREIGLKPANVNQPIVNKTQNEVSAWTQLPPKEYVNPVQNRLKQELETVLSNATYSTQPMLERTLTSLSGSSDVLSGQLNLLLEKAKNDLLSERMSKVNVPVGSITYSEILKEQLADPSLEKEARARLNLDTGYSTVQKTKTDIDNERRTFEDDLKARKDQSPGFLRDLRAVANEYVEQGDGSTFGDRYTNAPLVTAVARLAQVDPKLSSYIIGDKPTLESLQNRKKSDYTRMVESARDYVKYNTPAAAKLEDALKEFRAKSGRNEVDVKSATNLINTLIEALGKIEAK